MTARRGKSGMLRLALVYAALLASLCVVVWRQSRAMEALRAVDALRRERAVLAAERVELVRTLERLESRSRIVGIARRELDMHIPASGDVVLLRWHGTGLVAEAPDDRAELLSRARIRVESLGDPEPRG